MGLLSFFTRRSTHDKKSLNVLKAQPYNATIASLPPTIGTYPVAGNGPNVLEIARVNKALEIQEPEDDDPREAGGEGDRPRTAPSQSGSHLRSYSRSDSLKANLVPSVKGPPYRLPDKGPDQSSLTSKQRPPYRLSSTVPEPSVPIKPNPAFAHGTPSFVRSRTSSFVGGFVDILDAQSHFTPTDFRHRLLATGARDYGEDVADRNMGENGINLDSAETRAFYSSISGASAPAPSISRTAHDLDQRELRTKKRHSSDLRSRTKSLTSDSNQLHLTRTTSSELEQPPVLADRRPVHDTRHKRESSSTKADRRSSLPAYAGSWRRKDGHDREVDDFPETLRIRVKDASRTSRDTGQSLQVRPVSSHRLSISSKHSRDSAAFVVETRPTSRGSSHRGPLVTRQHQPKSTKASRRETMCYASKPVPSQSPTKRLSLQSVQSSSTYQNTIRDSSRQVRPESAGIDSPSHHSRQGSVTNIQASPPAELHMTAFQSPRPTRPHMGQESRDSLMVKTYLRPQIPVFSPDRSHRRLEIEDSIPDRSSSLRNLSIDSTSGTSLSSSPFRPQSRHTANTSVDLAPFVKGVNSSYDSLGMTSYRTAAESWAQSSSAVNSISSPRSPLRNTERSPTFNIDDYISSDGEFESEGHQGEEPEDLLFRDTGYGFEGAELPGLTSLLDMPTNRPTPPILSLRTRSLNEQALSAFHQDLNGLKHRGVNSPLAEPWVDRSQHRSRSRVSTHNLEDSDGGDLSDQEVREYDDIQDEFSFDIPLTRHDITMRQYRQSRYATREEDIEEEKEYNKLDISTAVRLRKEAKRRNRQSGFTVRRRGEMGKEKEEAQRQQVDPDGFDADVE